MVTELIGPFVTRIGDGWSTGELSIGHEHFATYILQIFLSDIWRRLNANCDGPYFVLSTLENERHVLGLEMCAVITTLAGRRVVFFGEDMPNREIVKISNNLQPKALCLSLSSHMPHHQAKKALSSIRDALDDQIVVITGGKGALDGLQGVEHIDDFSKYLERI